MFVSVTRVHMRSWLSVPGFLIRSTRAARQAERSAGFVAGWVGDDSEGGFWTGTVWQTLEAMQAFRNGGVHLKTMPKQRLWCDEASFAHWEQAEPNAPDPETAYQRLAREGMVSKLAEPSARHKAGEKVGSTMPRPRRHLKPRAIHPSLLDPAVRDSIIARLRKLSPQSSRKWGRMTPHQAMCHLSDSFKGVAGSNPLSSAETFLNRTLVKWIALDTSMKWPPGVKTRPEVDQEIGGTKPVEFEADRRTLETLIEQFSRLTSNDLQPHPIFGRLTTAQWQRWGYRHVDHHLRQFGA